MAGSALLTGCTAAATSSADCPRAGWITAYPCRVFAPWLSEATAGGATTSATPVPGGNVTTTSSGLGVKDSRRPLDLSRYQCSDSARVT